MNNSDNKKNRFVISICGGSGSGKSSLAKCICEKMGLERASRIPTDFYLKSNPFPTLDEFFEHPLEYDWELVDQALLEEDGLVLTAPDYDFSNFRRISLKGAGAS